MLKLIIAILLLLPPLAQAQKLEQIVAEAKKEGEVKPRCSHFKWF